MKIYLIVKTKFIIILFFSTFFSCNLLSHHKIYSPRVDEGRRSLEWRGHFDIDKNYLKNKSHHHVFETEYSWTNFWQSEIELHISDKSTTPLNWEKTEFQNQLQIVDKNDFAAALYFSYNFVSEGENADEIEYKYLNEINNSFLRLTTNFIFEKQVGPNSSGGTEFSFSNYLFFDIPIIQGIKAGLIGFSELGYIRNFNVFSKQEHHYGIQFEKDIETADKNFEISIGYLNGISYSSSNHKFIWNTEIEF